MSKNPLNSQNPLATRLDQKMPKSLVRRASGLMALEQRFMFDGAAIDTAVEVSKPVVDTLLHFVAADTAMPAAVVTARAEAEKLVADFLAQPDAKEQLFALFNGGQSAPSAQWQAAVDQLLGNRQADAVRVELRTSAELQGAKGAFSVSGTTGQFTIYLNSDWLAGNPSAGIGAADSASVTSVLVEELGHYLDAALNQGVDTAGDEGEHFSRVLLQGIDPYGLDITTAQDDRGTLVIDGQRVNVEFASFTFVNAYQMITDRNGDGIVQNTENWADKEQSSHTLLVSGSGTDASFGGLGQVSINDDASSSQFSGNDVSAIGLNIGGINYYGWISRPVKVGGQVVGFYFWTDQNFTSLASAQLDGNQDSDTANAPSDPGVTDNKGFILVVNQSYFTGLIGSMTSVPVATSTVWSAVTAGTYNTIEVGSSSDRVDAALNSLIPLKPTLSAVNDASDINVAAGTAGGPALELGSDGNNPTRSTYYATLNTNLSTGVMTNTVDAQGNVITNDASATAVTRIESNSTQTNANVTTITSGVIQGLYGTLTINADGSYTYSISNDNPTVNALLPLETLSDVFTYTVTDGKSSTATAMLTVRIKGSNDAPIAYHDTNIAKEITSTANTGYSATGNVITNDTDVDANDQLALDLGVSDYTKTISVSNITSTTPKSQLIFEGDLGSNIKNNSYIGIKVSSVDYKIYNGNTGTTQVQIVGDKVSTGDTDGDGVIEYAINLNSTALWYGTAGSRTQITLGDNQAYIFSTSSALNATQSATTMSADVVGKETINATGLGLTSSNLFVGMQVTGSAWGSNSYVSAITIDGSGNVTSFDVTVSSNIDKTAYPTTVATNFSLTYKNILGTYGTLNLKIDGSYTYTPYTDITALAAGASATDGFTYTVTDQLGAKSKANLNITVYGSGSTDPAISAGTVSVDELGYDSNATTARGTTNPVSGTLTVSNTTNPTYNITTPGTAFSGTGTLTSTATTVTSSSYGTLTLKGDGTYTYSLGNTNSTVNALQLGQTLTDTFYYSVTNHSTNTSGSVTGSTVSTITITINGSNDTPTAYGNTGSLTEDSGLTAQGNVILDANTSSQVDADVDNGDSFTVTRITNTAATSNSNVTTATTIAGAWGYLTINTDGAYSYRHYVSTDAGHTTEATTIQNLTVSQSETDTFTYTITDTKGRTSTADLVITVNGANETPVNTTPTSVSTSEGSYAFSGNLSVADADNNVKTVVLHVDNGTLSINTATLTSILPFVTITSSDGGKTLTLTVADATAIDRTDSDGETYINQLLAKLTYQVNTAAAGQLIGGDYLTIQTTDTNGAYDSDGFPITIPVTATVNEAGLAQSGADVPSDGTAESTSSETFTTLIDLPLGRKVPDVTLTPTTYGCYSITNGVLTYILTKRANHSGGAVTDTFSYSVTNLDGSSDPVSTPVTINIVDDGPSAVPDTNNAQDGGSQITGNVLTDGVNDVFGADGEKTTSPTGGVMGVRSAVTDTSTLTTDTTTAVISGAGGGTPIAGLYGSLILKSDGSYTYTPGDNSLVSAVDDVFVYTIEDADGNRSTTTLTIDVHPATLSTVDLAMDKTATFDTASGKVTYTLTVNNTEQTVDNGGSGLASSGFTVTDTLSSDLSSLEYSTNGTSFDSTLPTGVSYDSTTRVLTWVGGTLVAEGSTSLYVRAVVAAGTATLANTATVDGDDFDNDTADNTDTVTPPVADLAIDKSATVNAAGTEVTYTLVVTNTGGSAATGVSVTDAPPTGLTYTVVSLNSNLSSPITDTAVFDPATGVWEIGNLAINGTATLYLKASITAGTASLANTANVDGDQYDNDTADNTDTVTPKVIDLSILKSATVNAAGTEIVYALAVTNNDGSEDATGVKVTDTLPAGLTATAYSYNSDFSTNASADVVSGVWTVNGTGALTHGVTKTLYIKATITAGTASLANTATVDGDQYDNDTADNTDTVTPKVIDLSILKSATVNAAGTEIVYALAVTNNDGSEDATGVKVTDTLPAGLTATAYSYNSDFSTNASADVVSGVWTVDNTGALAHGVTKTLYIKATITAGTASLANTATVDGDQYDNDTADNTDTVTPKVVDLDMNKTATFDTASAKVTYRLEVVGDSTVDSSGFTVTDTLPTGLSSLEYSFDGTFTDTVTGVSYVSGTRVLTWDGSALTHGTSISLYVRAVVAAGTTTLANTATVDGDDFDDDTRNDSASVSVTPDGQAADLVTVKTLSSSDATPLVGSTVTFLITVTNNGGATATNVKLTDQLPSGLTYTANIASVGSYNNGTGLWTIGTLANGASATLQLSATVNAANEGASITNTTGKATSDQTDSTDVGNDLTETVTVDKPPVASDDSATFTPGTPTTVNVVSNDTTGDTVVATTVVFTSGSATDSGKTLVVAGEGTWRIDATTGAITFTPLAGFTANPTAVEYKVADAQGNFDSATVTLANGAADLVTAKTLSSSDATPLVGSTVTFLITVTNNGGATATNVKLTDQLPSGLTYTANIASVGSYNNGTGLWTIGTLANGASATLQLSATVNAANEGASITNTTGKATSDQTDSTDSGNDLTETVTVDKPPVATNDSATFTPGTPTTVNVVSNDTTGDTVVATTVVFTSGSATDSGKTLVVAGEGTWRIDATTGAITFTPLAGFTANPTAVEYKVADAQGNFDSATVTLANGAADLSLSKTVNNANPNVGDNVTFTLTVTNSGPNAATNVTVNDTLPAGLSYVSDSGSGAYANGVWTVGTLANGATATLTIVARADSASNVVNSATAHGDQTDPNSTNDTSSASVDGLPALTVTDTVVNEASPFAFFTVTGEPGQLVTLALVDGTAISADYGSLLETSSDGGVTWTPYSGGTVALNGTGGTLLVRTPVKQDTIFEGAETFSLKAANTGGKSAQGTVTILDDGTGKVYDDKGVINPTVTPDDDRPKPAVPVLPPQPAPVVEPPALQAPPEPPRLSPPPFDSAIAAQPAVAQVVMAAPTISDVLTSTTGFRVVVNESAPPGLTLFKGVTDQFVDPAGSSKISLPADAFIHSKQDAVIKLDAKMADDSKLPEWVRFDPATGSFEIQAPADFKGKLEVKVTAQDGDGREATSIFRIFVGEEPATTKPQSRLGLTEKIRLASMRALPMADIIQMDKLVKPREVVQRETAQRAARG